MKSASSGCVTPFLFSRQPQKYGCVFVFCGLRRCNSELYHSKHRSDRPEMEPITFRGLSDRTFFSPAAPASTPDWHANAPCIAADEIAVASLSISVIIGRLLISVKCVVGDMLGSGTSTPTHQHTRTHAYTLTRARTHTHANTHARTRTHTRTHARTHHLEERGKKRQS